MFDYKSIVPDDELTMEFSLDPTNPKRLIATKDNVGLGTVTLNEATFEASDDNVFMQYKLWQTRPERAVGRQIALIDRNMEELITNFEELFIGAYILTHETKINGIDKPRFQVVIDWLRTTDFYTAPASSRYHDSMPGGLLIHSLRVYNKLMSLLELPEFKSIDKAQATIVALTHDWCKIGYYEPYQKNVKNKITGQWEKETAYKINQKGFPFGHGASSLYVAMRLLKLTEEQALAIRWHQGEYNVCTAEMNELQLANQKYPLVYALQFADRLACTSYCKDI